MTGSPSQRSLPPAADWRQASSVTRAEESRRGAGAGRAATREGGKDALVADERAEAALRDLEHGRHDPGPQLPHRRHHLADEEEHTRKGDVLAEGHELHLVVGVELATAGVDEIDSV